MAIIAAIIAAIAEASGGAVAFGSRRRFALSNRAASSCTATHVVRRPIYVQRPVVNVRYYNYQQPPALIVENYAAMDGYYWVAGVVVERLRVAVDAGHYEPDPNYDAQYYDELQRQRRLGRRLRLLGLLVAA